MRDIRKDKENTSILKCNVMKLDDFIEKEGITNIDFIKIDIEGAELFALMGGGMNIKKHKPIIFCEMLRKWTKKFDYHPNDIINLLKSFGYVCYAIKENIIEKIYKITDDTIETNFLFLDKNKQRHKDIINKLSLGKYK